MSRESDVCLVYSVKRFRASTARDFLPLGCAKGHVPLPLACQVLVPFLAEPSFEAVLGVEGPLESACEMAAHLLSEHLDRRKWRLCIGTEKGQPTVTRRDVSHFVEVNCRQDLSRLDVNLALSQLWSRLLGLRDESSLSPRTGTPRRDIHRTPCLTLSMFVAHPRNTSPSTLDAHLYALFVACIVKFLDRERVGIEAPCLVNEVDDAET